MNVSNSYNCTSAHLIKSILFIFLNLDLISEVGFDETYGARPIKRAIQDKIEDFVSEEIIKGNMVEGVPYTLISVEKEVVVKTEPTKKTRKKKEDN
jgi:ATP-dependent Clp protease ATP-binding subunit ClpC